MVGILVCHDLGLAVAGVVTGALGRVLCLCQCWHGCVLLDIFKLILFFGQCFVDCP